jgi:hypothetical protein
VLRWGGLGVLLVVTALLAPASALAGETFAFGPGSVTSAHLRATHGYRVNFSENDKGYFFVRVKGHGSTTDFAVKTGRAPGDHLHADFGRRGSFDLRFVPVGRPESVPVLSACHGPKGSWQVGYLAGRARFRTERGFAQIRIHRVPAARDAWSHQVCEFAGLPSFGHPQEKRATFSATAAPSSGAFSLAPPDRSLTFSVTQFYRHARPADRRVAFAAERKEAAGRIKVHRRVVAAAPERTLLFPGAPRMPEEIAVRPPAPFAGGAELLRTHESTFTWTGDLAVTFPGLDPIRLTGPRFSTMICALKGCAGGDGEEDASGS